MAEILGRETAMIGASTLMTPEHLARILFDVATAAGDWGENS
jgi:hypothetical protein